MNVATDVQIDSFRRMLRRKLAGLRLRYRFTIFLEVGLLGLAVVFVASGLLLVINKFVYVPATLQSQQALLIAATVAVFLSLVWSLAYPLRDATLASLVDHEIGASGCIESAVDFISRPEEIDPAFLGPFIQQTARFLSSMKNRDIVSIGLPKTGNAALLALLLMLSISHFIPDVRLVREDQDPFLFRDLRKLSSEMKGAIIGADRQDGLTKEQRELVEKARELARQMDAEAVDPDFLKDQLSKLSHDIKAAGEQSAKVNKDLLSEILSRLEEMSETSQDEELQGAIQDLTDRLRQLSESQSAGSHTGLAQAAEAINDFLLSSSGRLASGDLAQLSELSQELQNQADADQMMSALSEAASDSADLMRGEQIDPQDLIRRSQMMAWPQQERGASPEADQSGSLQRMMSQDGNEGSANRSDAGDADGQDGASGDLGLLSGSEGLSDDSAGSSEGMSGLGDQSGSGRQPGNSAEGMLMSPDPAPGIGTGVNPNLFGGDLDLLGEPPTQIDNTTDTQDQMDLSSSLVLGEATPGESQLSPEGPLATQSSQGYEGEVAEGKYPEKYRDIVSQYFTKLN